MANRTHVHAHAPRVGRRSEHRDGDEVQEGAVELREVRRVSSRHLQGLSEAFIMTHLAVLCFSLFVLLLKDIQVHFNSKLKQELCTHSLNMHIQHTAKIFFFWVWILERLLS